MASNQTSNYKLNQWKAEDRVMREDFNADNAKIDAALGLFPQLVFGSYTGDGTVGRTIDLGFEPKAVFVVGPEGLPFYSSGGAQYFCGGLAFPGVPAVETYRKSAVVSVCENGFQVSYNNLATTVHVYSNTDGAVYQYIAIRP